jgi:two-component system sensor histidine kinase AdeS
MRQSRLNSALAILMLKVTLYSTAISFFVYFVTTWILVNWLGQKDLYDDYTMTGYDWLQFALGTFFSLFASILTAFKFSKHLLHPLISLADTTRKIASGTLSARANVGEVKIKEAASLINDFNTMAERLETTSGEIKTWNAAIAHELRTPITILHGRLQGLADGLFQPEPALFMNLLKQTDGLMRLIEDLRTISLADSGYLTLRKEIVDLSQEITAITEIITPSLNERKITPVLRLDDVYLSGDAMRIRQAMLALMDNTRRYAVSGIVMIACYAENDNAIITLEDEGPGVPDTLIDSLFAPFKRADDSRSREHGGSGLGLAVVNSIVNAHQGSIVYFPSKLGGAGFKISLPFQYKDANVP